jgi:hypothetical protein
MHQKSIAFGQTACQMVRDCWKPHSISPSHLRLWSSTCPHSWFAFPSVTFLYQFLASRDLFHLLFLRLLAISRSWLGLNPNAKSTMHLARMRRGYVFYSSLESNRWCMFFFRVTWMDLSLWQTASSFLRVWSSIHIRAFVSIAISTDPFSLIWQSTGNGSLSMGEARPSREFHK